MIPVLGKINCIFEYIQDDKGRITGNTSDKCVVNPVDYIVTAKIDGTCCFIKDGQIFARQDVKNNVKNAPQEWFPTAGTEPDKGGHIIGFRPLKKTSDKWHFAAIDDTDNTQALFLEYDNKLNTFQYKMRTIADFNGKTCELVGPKINGNKHGLTRHCYVIHGSIIVNAPWKTHGELKDWLLSEEGIFFEGIVIHDSGNNALYKCHRGHLGLPWNGYMLPVT